MVNSFMLNQRLVICLITTSYRNICIIIRIYVVLTCHRIDWYLNCYQKTSQELIPHREIKLFRSR